MAFLVFGDLGVGVSRRVADDDWDFSQSCTLRRAPPLRAEVDAVLPLLVGRMNDDRLQDAVLPDVFGQLIQLGFWKLGARVGRVLAEGRERQQLRRRWDDSLGRRDRRLCSGCWRDLRGCCIEQVELHVLGLVPELEHDGIVPTDACGEKSPAMRAPHGQLVP